MGKSITIDPELEIALKMFKHFFNTMGQPLCILNKQGQHIYYNQENAALDETTPEQVLGQKMQDIFPNIKTEENEMLRALHTGEQSISNNKHYYNSAGKLINYRHTTVPLYNDTQEIIGVIEAGQDISNIRVLHEQIIRLNEQLFEKHQPSQQIIYSSPKMQQLMEKAELLAKSSVPIMIAGETGTGKELLAQRIYSQSKRKNKPFIALNCAALPSSLIESTLFGSVRGAFTGAENRKGYLELADNGTLFLDELNTMPLEIQSKLLRFLQEKTFWKVGGNHEQTANIRIICAMNESPFEMIQQGRLRADIYYRLEIGLLHIPPLRERTEDIIPLANYFVKKHRHELEKKITHISPVLEEQLQTHRWKGNIRMLENVIIRSMLMQKSEGALTSLSFNNDLDITESETIKTPAKPEHPATTPPVINLQNAGLSDIIAQYERVIIVNTLTQHNGSVSGTAKTLRMSRGSLQYKIKKYNIKMTVTEL